MMSAICPLNWRRSSESALAVYFSVVGLGLKVRVGLSQNPLVKSTKVVFMSFSVRTSAYACVFRHAKHTRRRRQQVPHEQVCRTDRTEHASISFSASSASPLDAAYHFGQSEEHTSELHSLRHLVC